MSPQAYVFLFALACIVLLICVVIWQAKKQARAEEKQKQAEDANERNNKIAAINNAQFDDTINIDSMLRKRRK